MRLITILTDPNAYFDRLASIDALQPYVERNIVICKMTNDGFRERFRGIEFICCDRPIAAWTYFRWAAQKTAEICRGSEHEWCIVEIATPVTLILLRLRWRIQSKLVQQLVFPVVPFMRHRGWTSDSYAPPCGLLQWLQWYSLSLCRQLMQSVAIRTCDGFIANSEQSVVAIRNRDIVVDVILNCVMNADTGVKDRRPKSLLAVSAIQPHKGIGILLEAFRRVCQVHPDCRLIIAGRVAKRDAAWFDRLQRKYADVWPHVDYLGAVDREKLNELYSTAQVSVLSSLYEGSPRVVYESLARGCPVIASDIPGICDIAPDASWLLTFSAGNPRSCADLILKCLARSESLKELENQMIEFVRHRYSPEARARRLFNSLSVIMDDRRNAIDNHAEVRRWRH